MIIYAGRKFVRTRIVLNGVTYVVRMLNEPQIVDEIRILSLDDFILKDSEGVYLLPKEDE